MSFKNNGTTLSNDSNKELLLLKPTEEENFQPPSYRTFLIKAVKYAAVTSNCLDDPPVDRDRRNGHPGLKVSNYYARSPLVGAAVAEWYRYRTVACLVTSSSPIPLKTHRVGQRCTINLSRAETSSRWCDVVVRRGGVPAQVSSTSLDHGSKLRGPSPKALV
ncbi:uncharacterized protein TNCV_2462901 [Trichonephila clavipes]|nr:uncharacterized protein TNCV_2462901 [Trichonephila clavipes]